MSDLNPMAPDLMSPLVRREMIRAYLLSRFPKFRKAKSAARLVRADGTCSRHITLYEACTDEGRCGQCAYLTMQYFVQAGLWEHESVIIPDYQDYGYERWYPVVDRVEGD